MQWAQLMMSVTSGGRSYFSTILKVSRNSQVERLEALVPNLNPATGVMMLEGIQATPGKNQHQPRRESHHPRELDCLTAGVELLNKGIETRLA